MDACIVRVASPVVALFSFGLASALAQTTERASVDSSSAQANSTSGQPSISADGRFVAFGSAASNLVAGDTNGANDVFVRDRQGWTTARVSVSSAGAQGNAHSRHPSISADGHFIAFFSDATNLVAGDTNAASDVFVYDRVAGTTELVSVTAGGWPGSAASIDPRISADGRFVAFASFASDLVAFDTNGLYDCFVRDRQTATTELVSVSSSGAQGNQASSDPAISADGRFVAFQSGAALAPGDSDLSLDVYVRDRTNGTTEFVSIAAGGSTAGSGYACSISGDGRIVAFRSDASSLVAGDTNAAPDIFVRDRMSGTTARVSVDSSGAQGNSGSYAPWVSGDGRFVAFRSDATNLVTADTNAVSDVFVRDLIAGTIERASLDSNGAQANAGSVGCSLSDDGRYALFESDASNLVANDTNGWRDVFVHDRGAPQPVTFCTTSTSTNGCAATLHAGAHPSVSFASACMLTVANVEGQKSGLLFYGIGNTPFVPIPWGPGSTSWLCVKPPTQRTPIQNSGGTFSACDGSFALDWNAYQSAHPLALGNPWSVGDKVYVQAWFRDPLAVKSTNLSDALEMTYLP